MRRTCQVDVVTEVPAECLGLGVGVMGLAGDVGVDGDWGRGCRCGWG